MRELCGKMKMFYIIIVVAVTQIYTLSKLIEMYTKKSCILFYVNDISISKMDTSMNSEENFQRGIVHVLSMKING